MSKPARGAALRGDDYQHIIGLHYAARVLTDPELDSVSIEDAAGGAFDDVVVRSTATSRRPHRYMQVKSGVYREAVIDDTWLRTQRTPNGRSPLQHFHTTWTTLTAAGEPFELQLISNKNYDHNDPILALIDNLTNKIAREKLDAATPRSKVGKQLTSWATHLNVAADELKTFLSDVEFVHGESAESWATRTADVLRNAGFRHDPDAVCRARDIVRGWVISGAGPRNTNDMRAEFATAGLLARDGELVLAVHAIDHVRSAQRPNAEVDIVDLYPDADPFERRELLDPAAWDTTAMPRLIQARRDLDGFGTRKLHITAHMRLPMYFAVGRTFPDVAGWVLSTDQRGQLWTSSAEHDPTAVVVHTEQTLDQGPDLAVAVALTYDPTDDVRAYLHSSAVPVRQLLTLSAAQGPSTTAVPGAGWARGWARGARERVRTVTAQTRPPKIHLFLCTPAGQALFLGHDWNLLPTTCVYEHLGGARYTPTLTLKG